MRMPSGEQSVFLGVVMEMESIGDGSLVVVEFSWRWTDQE